MLAVMGAGPEVAGAQEERPTIQDRFGTKAETLYLQGTMTTQVRNDYYDSIGVGVDAGWYASETIGLEARWAYLFSALGPAAAEVKNETGLTPDARPQDMLATVGLRYSVGYGKMLLGRDSVVHFDPQIAVHGGVALAERRVLPTGTVSLSLLTHYQYGLQATFDLGVAIQAEHRQRGWVPSVGFMPTLGIGWGGDFDDMAELLSLDRGDEEADGGGETGREGAP